MFEHVGASNEDSYQPWQFQGDVADPQQLPSALAGNGLLYAHGCLDIQEVSCVCEQGRASAIEGFDPVWVRICATPIRRRVAVM
jgi:hypothetical protein